MTKDQLQKELKDKVKPGVKPSDLRKLKRSKSEGDISTPPAPPLPSSVPISRSKSQEPFKDEKYPYTVLISQSQELETLRKETQAKSTTISLLRKKLEGMEKSNPPNLLLSEQLKAKQQELEQLRAKLETKPATTELDQSLFARHQNLKSWFKQYQKTKHLDAELEENINEASTELENQDKTISQLRGEIRKLKQTNQSLQKDLELAQRLAQSRKIPFLSPEPSPFLRYTLYSLATVFFTVWLVNSYKR